jgi:hypothetical protein
MNTELGQQIVDFLYALADEREKDIRWVIENWIDDEIDEDPEDEDNIIIQKIEKMFGKMEFVSSDGGHEGGGEHVERVIRFGDVHIRFTGYYDSNNGIEFDGGFEYVLPRRTLKMVYETPDERGDKKDEV